MCPIMADRKQGAGRNLGSSAAVHNANSCQITSVGDGHSPGCSLPKMATMGNTSCGWPDECASFTRTTNGTRMHNMHKASLWM